MVVRGENSDILTSETVAEMARRHPNLETLEIADQGHTPLLAEPDTIARIAAFAAACDARRP
jgi:pimeloyl-ACP methyl ester carboxylesterase